MSNARFQNTLCFPFTLTHEIGNRIASPDDSATSGPTVRKSVAEYNTVRKHQVSSDLFNRFIIATFVIASPAPSI